MSRRNALRLVVAVVVIGTLASTPALWRRAQLVYWLRQCRTYELPADQVVYEHGAPGLIAPPWQRLYETMGGAFRSNGTVFLHELTAPSGARRLVAVDLVTDPRLPSVALIQPIARVLTDGSFLRPPVQVRSDSGIIFRGARVFYAGRVDPNDPSHFTIDYEIDGQRRTLDGWLRGDDTVVIEPRE